ncbi:MAG: DMT family transporter [Candidatus Pacebacteria bacterium]|nr:DMT family transporter [Candidatus Paceibacterota bacterium]
MENSSKTLKGSALVVCAALLWALDGVIRRSLFTLPPITIIFFEHLFGAIIILPFVWKALASERLLVQEWLMIILISLLSGLFGTLWFTTALLKSGFISFSVVFLLQKLQPIFAISTARIFLKEKLTKKYIIWAVLALVAAYFVTFPKGIVNFSTGSGTVIAALYALGAAFAWGSSTTFSKIALKKRSHSYVTAVRFFITTLLALCFMIIIHQTPSLHYPSLSQFARFALIAVSTGMLALLIYYKGLQKIPVKVSTILELTFPLVAILIDAILYHSFLSFSQAIAAIVLIASMYKISTIRISENETSIQNN